MPTRQGLDYEWKSPWHRALSCTVVVNGPNGEWYCDDDTGEDNNPLVTLGSQAGRYEIWVGTYSSGSPAPAVLSISELANF